MILISFIRCNFYVKLTERLIFPWIQGFNSFFFHFREDRIIFCQNCNHTTPDSTKLISQLDLPMSLIDLENWVSIWENCDFVKLCTIKTATYNSRFEFRSNLENWVFELGHSNFCKPQLKTLYLIIFHVVLIMLLIVTNS